MGTFATPVAFLFFFFYKTIKHLLESPQLMRVKHNIFMVVHWLLVVILIIPSIGVGTVYVGFSSPNHD